MKDTQTQHKRQPRTADARPTPIRVFIDLTADSLLEKECLLPLPPTFQMIGKTENNTARLHLSKQISPRPNLCSTATDLHFTTSATEAQHQRAALTAANPNREGVRVEHELTVCQTDPTSKGSGKRKRFVSDTEPQLNTDLTQRS